LQWTSLIHSARGFLSGALKKHPAYGDPRRRLNKRKKDEMDLIRLAEAYPELYPSERQEQLDCG